jgi:hypothetical protein
MAEFIKLVAIIKSSLKTSAMLNISLKLQLRNQSEVTKYEIFRTREKEVSYGNLNQIIVPYLFKINVSQSIDHFQIKLIYKE